MASRAFRSTSLAAVLALGCGLSTHGAAPGTALASLVPGTQPPGPTAPPAPLEAQPPPPPPVAWARGLGPIVVVNENTTAEASVRLYRETGEIDPDALDLFVRVACDGPRGGKLSTRVVQLALKAAYHFHADKMFIVSAYRPLRRGKGGYHARGQALDFWLPGVDYRKLASHLRSYPRAGVGVYTNPHTHFVHVDDRDMSFHWLDASPPHVTWREAPLGDPTREERDASYTPESDLPEH